MCDLSNSAITYELQVTLNVISTSFQTLETNNGLTT